MTNKPSMDMGVNRLRRTFLQSIVVVGLGLLAAFLWLGAIREPISLATSKSKLAQVAVDGRAHIIALYLTDLEERIEQLADSVEPYTTTTQLTPEAVGLPDAAAVSYIPLGDLGTVRISPGDHGLKSHIDIDIVRRAFAGEQPPPESIQRAETIYTLFARGAGDPLEGVILVEMTNDRLNTLVSASEEGQYQLLQRQSNGGFIKVAGDLAGASAASARVTGSLWSLQFQPDEGWLAVIQPAWWSLAGAIFTALSGFGLGAYWLLSRPQKVLEDEVSRILAQADQGLTITISTPALQPVAKSLIDLNSLVRSKLAASKASPQTAPVTDGSSRHTPEQPSIAREGLEAAPESPAVSVAPEQDDSIPEHIFEDTGIRGLAESELSGTLIEQIGRALAALCADKGISALLIARDGEASSDKLRTQLTQALVAGGVDILDLEEVPLPLLQFATYSTDADSGIMITSNSGQEPINRLQLIFNRQLVTGQGIEEILDAIRADKGTSGSGHISKQPITEAYQQRVVADISLALPLKVVLDHTPGANTPGSHTSDTMGAVAASLIESLGCEVVSADVMTDNTKGFTPLEETLSQLGQKVIAEGADLGVTIDSHRGRLLTVTNEGLSVHTDQLLMVLAQDVLERNPGADVIYDVNFTRHFAPFITRCGGRPQMTASDHKSVSEKLVDSNGLIAATFSGQFFFIDRWFAFDDALYAMARLLEVLSSQSKSYQEMLSSLPVSVSIPELLIPLESSDRKKIMRALVSHPEFPGARITTLDGLRIDYADGWGVIRNAPDDSALAMRVEGNDNASLSRIKGVLKNALSEAAPELTMPL